MQREEPFSLGFFVENKRGIVMTLVKEYWRKRKRKEIYGPPISQSKSAFSNKFGMFISNEGYGTSLYYISKRNGGYR